MAQHDHDLPPARIAFVIDNVVADVLHTDEKLAAVFLSQPTIIDVTDKDNSLKISVNSVYDPQTGEFTDAPPSNQSVGMKIMPEDVVTDPGEDSEVLQIPATPPNNLS